MSVYEEMHRLLPAGLSGTMPVQYWPNMMGPSVRKTHCVCCGAALPNGGEQHHVVFRSHGELYNARGRKMEKPTLTLCGFGNSCGCHGLAHSRRLHFRYVTKQMEHTFAEKSIGDSPLWGSTLGGHWEFLVTDEPTEYIDALELEGWQRIR